MSATTLTAGSTGTTSGPRRRRWIGVAGALVVVAVLLAATVGREGSTDLPLDPRNPGPEGAEAVARVLEREGVAVDVVRSQEELLATDAAGATVVVTAPEDLSSSTARTLREHAASGVALVLAGPGEALAASPATDEVDTVTRSEGEVDAGCSVSPAAGLRVALSDGSDLRVRGGTACFGDPGALVLLPGTDVPTYLLAAPEVLANGTVTDADNAALALRLLGQGDRVLWYLPDPDDAAPDETVGLLPLLPPWLLPSLWLLAVAGGAALLWRGRRLGPLVVEPLPVVVRAAESTHARGRLYHRAGDRAHAARVLREATRQRLVHHLLLRAEATPDEVAEAVARRTTRDAAAVRGLLSPDHPPTRDTELADLGRRLTALEDEVHKS